MSPASLINISDASTTLQDAGAFSAPMFTTLYPIALVAVGLIIGAIFVRLLYNAIIHAVWSAAVGGNPQARRFSEDHPSWF